MEKFWSLTPQAARYSQARAASSSKIVVLSALWFCWAAPAHAVDLITALQNLRNLVLPMTQLLLTFSFVTGLFFIFKAISMMKKFGMMNTYGAQPGEFIGPITYLFVGVLLVWLPSTSSIMTATIFGSSAPDLFGQGSFDYTSLGTGSQLLAYIKGSTLQAQWSAIADTLVLYIQFIGLIAFIRGWFIVAKATQPGHQPGSMGKGVTHIIGGILAINFVQFVHLFQATLGM